MTVILVVSFPKHRVELVDMVVAPEHGAAHRHKPQNSYHSQHDRVDNGQSSMTLPTYYLLIMAILTVFNIDKQSLSDVH